MPPDQSNMKCIDTTSRWSGSEVAIIGMAGRFAGAPNIEAFWNNLRDGVESISSFGDKQLLASGVDPEALKNPRYVKAGSILEGIENFDAEFFGFSPRAAAAMDPQHRIFLECVWEAIETAGYDAERYKGPISVFAGASLSSYLFNNLGANLKAYALSGMYESYLHNAPDSLTTLAAYKLNLKGACYNVGTFCSTSLVAVHLACQSLLNLECDLAIAGGVRVAVPQYSGYWYEQGSIVSPDGHCRPFDAKAEGTVFGNGVAAVVLKRLKDALDDGDSIDAVILGSATNNDGALKVSYAAPSVAGQAEVIAEALANANVPQETITYVEAHGTGTALGDPIEVAALTRAFREGTGKSGFCALGSVKSNIGHTDAVSGVSGLVKAVLSLKHRQIPPTLHFQAPNPDIDFANSPFYVASSLLDWKTENFPRRAGVSSFGIGGTNAHVVLQEAPIIPVSDASREHQLLVLSAKTGSALEAATRNLATFLKTNPDAKIADAAYTLQTGRKVFNHRRFVVCRGPQDAAAALEAPEGQRRVTAFQETTSPEITFMFSGQGSQYADMGAELYKSEGRFREQVDLCSEILEPHLGLDIRKLLYPANGSSETAGVRLNETAITQPALFLTEYALAQLWIGWGVRPASMIGHSIGEYVAACLSGVFSLEDALAVVAARGRLMQSQPKGSMLAVTLADTEVRRLINGNHLSVAAVNAPALCSVSGTEQEVARFREKLHERNVESRSLHTSHAFHSSMMDPILGEFRDLLDQVKRQPPKIPFISNVSGTWITPEDAMSAEYWVRHSRETVQFSAGARELLRKSNQVFLEVGPGRTLSTFVRQHQNGSPKQPVLSSLRHPQEQSADEAFILETVGKLWLAGVAIDWPGFHKGQKRRRIPLPTYPFERRRHWIDPAEPPRGYFAVRSALTGAQENVPSLADTSNKNEELLLRGAASNGKQRDLPDALEQQLAGVWENLLGVHPIEPTKNFFDLGGNSLTAVRLFSEIRRLTGKSLPLATLFEAPTIEKLAEVLRKDSSTWSSLVTIQPGGSQLPLFLIHGAEGNVLLYRKLAQYLEPNQPVYGFQSKGLSGSEDFLTSIEEMAAHYIKHLSVVQPHGPYRLGGYCLGGMVALEMARQLKASGEQVGLVALIDTYNPAAVPRGSLSRFPGLYLLQDLWFHAANMCFVASKGRWRFFREKWNVEVARAGVRVRALQHAMKSKNGSGVRSQYPHMVAKRINDVAALQYIPKPYSGRVVLIRPKWNFWGLDRSTFGWSEVIKEGLEVREMPVFPKGLLVEPFVQGLAHELEVCLKGAQ